jgi:mRNA interferase RelE/StbE
LAWTVEFDPRALNELEKLDRIAQKRIVRFLEERIPSRANPRDLGKALSRDKAGMWRYRVGDYRVICHIKDQAETVLVLRIAHRREAYR